MQELVWSTGIKYDKSERTANTNDIVKQENQIQPQKLDFDTGFVMKENKRDVANEKIGTRAMSGRMIMNPFRTDQNYVTDLKVQDDFLRPQSSDIN